MKTLHEAVRDSNIPLIKKLITDHHANVEATDDFGRTPLALAAYYGRVNVINTLITDHHANVEATDNLGRTPLQALIQFNDSIENILDVIQNAALVLRDQAPPAIANAMYTWTLDNIDVLNTLTHNTQTYGVLLEYLHNNDVDTGYFTALHSELTSRENTRNLLLQNENDMPLEIINLIVRDFISVIPQDIIASQNRLLQQQIDIVEIDGLEEDTTSVCDYISQFMPSILTTTIATTVLLGAFITYYNVSSANKIPHPSAVKSTQFEVKNF